jgi:protein involved in polysaccharide export with SLBB domain
LDIILVIKLFKLLSQAAQKFMLVSRGIRVPTSVSLLKYSILRLRFTLTGKAVTLVKPVLGALLLTSITASSYAITASQAASMVQANPGLLNTPEAQAALAERGLTSGDVLGQINENSAEVSSVSIEAGANDVDTSEDLEVESPPLKATSIYSNPLAYKSNADLLSEIKSQQSLSQDGVTERFSSVFFKNKNTQDLGSLPVPDYYIVSKGDELSIWIYGVTEAVIEAAVDSYGNVNIPIVGPLKIAGLAFVDAKNLIVSKLQTAYANSSIIVNIAKYSTIQVVLTGNVNAPGIYNVSALSTVKDLLIHAGGVKGNGTVRSMMLYRADGGIYEVDLYELLLGMNNKTALFLKTGDVIYIANAHKLVSLSGAVNTPARYELRVGEKLDKLLAFAGGIHAGGSYYGLKVSGYDDGQTQVRMVDASAAAEFDLNDRDSVYVYPIDKINIKAISIFGNVVRPGERELGKHASLAELITNEIDKFGLEGVFLNKTLFNFAMIKRKTDSLGHEFVRVNLAEILSGTVDEVLKSGDELYVFNKLDNSLNPFVKINGSVVIQQGEFQFIEGMTVSDLIQVAGVNSPYDTNKIKLITYQTDDLMPKVLILTDAEALSTKLSVFDEVEIFDFYSSNIVGKVSIGGSVISPRAVVLGQGMKLKDLILAAGGLSENVYYDHLRLTRIHNIGGKKFENEEISLSLVDVLNNGESNIALQDKDKVYIYSIGEMSTREKVVLNGEVRRPGEFFIGQGMKLKDLILAAGGYTEKAFLSNAEVLRYAVVNGNRTKEIIFIDLNRDGDFFMQNYDEITIYRIPNWYERKMVTLTGQVKFPGTYTFVDGDRLSDVLTRAGGYTDNAFLYGASFNRVSVKEMQQQALNDAMMKLKKKLALLSTQPKEIGTGEVSQDQLSETLSILSEQGSRLIPLGRVTINLPSDINILRGSASDITLRDGDSLNVPTANDTVMIIGEVMSPTAVIYDDDDVLSYIDKVGGLTPIANDNQIYVVHANGMAERFGGDFFFSSQVSVRPGDVIVVPQLLFITTGIQVAKDISSILYQFAITAASLKTVGVF